MNTSESMKNFRMMALAYCLGTFNDNLFKQSALLLMVAAGLHAMQGTATTLFALPFALFASYGGYLADRFPKGQVVLFAKCLELVAMLFGAAGIILGHRNLILTMVVIMSTQSVIFSPAINGAIPENFEPDFVPKANGFIKMSTTCSILLGMGLAGVMLDLFPGVTVFGYALPHILVGCTCIVVSIVGIYSAFAIRGLRYTAGKVPFPWLGPVESARICLRLWRDKELVLAFTCDAFFYGVSANLVMVINTLVVQDLHRSQTEASLAILSMMLGVALGALFMGRHTKTVGWARPLPPALAGMALGLCGVYALGYLELAEPLEFYLICSLLFMAGTCGGIFLLPFTNFIQVRPVVKEKGRIIGTSYFTSFGAIGLLGYAYSSFLAEALSSRQLMLLAGLACCCLALVVFFSARRLERTPRQSTEILS